MTITFFFSLALSLSKNSSLLFSTHCPLIPCQERGIALRLQPISWCQCFQRLPVTINTFAGGRMLLAASSSSSLPPAKVLVGATVLPLHGRPSPGAHSESKAVTTANVRWHFLCSRLSGQLDVPYLLSSSHQPRDRRISCVPGRHTARARPLGAPALSDLPAAQPEARGILRRAVNKAQKEQELAPAPLCAHSSSRRPVSTSWPRPGRPTPRPKPLTPPARGTSQQAAPQTQQVPGILAPQDPVPTGNQKDDKVT